MKRLLMLIAALMLTTTAFAQSYSPTWSTKITFKNGVNYMALIPAGISDTFTLTLPSTNGLTGQVLGLNGANTLGWLTPIEDGGAAGGDLTGFYPDPTINQSDATGTNIISALNLSSTGIIDNARTTATNAATPSTIVARDASSGFSAGQIVIIDQNEFRINDADNTNYIGFGVPSDVSTSFTLTLPIDNGNPGEVLQTDGNGLLAWLDYAAVNWTIMGNAGTSVVTDFIGTTDDEPFEIHVFDGDVANQGSKRVMRYEPALVSPNIIGGYQGNAVLGIAPHGNVIAGGGEAGGEENTITSTWSAVIGGGMNNTITLADYSVIGGGHTNAVSANYYNVIGGGRGNSIAAGYGTISGGHSNTITGHYSTIAGGSQLTLSGDHSFGFNANNAAITADMSVAAPFTAVFANANLWLANNTNAPSELRFYESYGTTGAFPNTANYVGFKAPAALTGAGDNVYTLPTDYPSADGHVLSSTMLGAMSWTSGSGLFIVNSTSLQSSANFNISGTGTASIFSGLDDVTGSDLTVRGGNGSSGAGGILYLSSGISTGTNNGSALYIASSNASTTGAGGLVSITSGNAAGNSANGGALTLTSGNGGGSTSNGGGITLTSGNSGTTSGNGGSISLVAGNSLTLGTGGLLALSGGNGAGANAGGTITVTSGTGGSTGNGGALTLSSGSGGSTSGNGGTVTLVGGSATNGNGGRIFITGTNAAGTDRDGGSVDMVAGNSTGSGAGGLVTITSGNGGTSSNGGAITVTSGTGGSTGNGGALTLSSGSGGSTSGNGGTVTLVGGSATNGNGGRIFITGTNAAGTDRDGGSVDMVAGNSTGSGAGGLVTITSGNGGTSSNGGAITVTAGSGGSTSGNGGTVTLVGGSATDGNGGNIFVTGTNAAGTDRDGGSIDMVAGNPTGTGAGGTIRLTSGSGGSVSITTGRPLRLFESTNSFYNSFLTSSQIMSVSYVLPTTLATAGQILSVSSVTLGSPNIVSLGWSSISSSCWMLTGNSGTPGDGSIFVGTSDAQPLYLKVNGGADNRMILFVNSSISLGKNATTGAADALAIGTNANAGGAGGSISIGLSSISTGASSISIGNAANSGSGGAITIGSSSTIAINSTNTVAIGSSAQVLSNSGGSISIGTSNIVTANSPNATAVGSNNNVSGTKSGAFGWGNTVSGTSSYAFGDPLSVTGNSSIAAGGADNTITADFASIFGGSELTLDGDRSFGFNANNAAGTASMSIAATNTAVVGNANLWLANTNGTASELRLYEGQATEGAFPLAATFYAAIKAPALGADYTLTLPIDDGTPGQVLSTSDGTGTLAWVSSLPPSGAAGGDLSGSYPGPTVSKINGATLGTTTATAGNVLVGDGAQWNSVLLQGDAAIDVNGVLNLATTGVSAASYGSATQVGTFSVDAAGRLIAAANVTISGVTPGGAAGGDLAGSYPNPTINTVTAGTNIVAALNNATPATLEAQVIKITSELDVNAGDELGLNLGNVNTWTADQLVPATGTQGTNLVAAINASTGLIDGGNVKINSTLVVAADLLGINVANPNGWTGLQGFTTVDINGGNIDGTAIGVSSVSTGRFGGLENTGPLDFNLGTGILHSDGGTGLITSSLIIDPDIDANANIAVTKLAAGAVGTVLTTVAGPTVQWSSLAGVTVTQLTGTANQVLVNAGVGPLSGAITLSTPQDIHTAATPQFGGMTLTGALTMSGSTIGNVGIIDNGASGVLLNDDLEVAGNLTLNTAAGVLHSDGGGLVTSSAVLLGSEVSGVLPIANGGTGVSTAATNGQLLIGNGTDFTLATIAPTTDQTTVTNTAGGIQIGTAQNINTTSSPTFAGLTITTSPAVGKVLTSDGSGNATWQNPGQSLVYGEAGVSALGVGPVVADYDLTLGTTNASKTYFPISSTADVDLNGIVGGVAGRFITLVNTGSFTITLKDDGADTPATNNIHMVGVGNDLPVGPEGVVHLIYTSGNFWRVVGVF